MTGQPRLRRCFLIVATSSLVLAAQIAGCASVTGHNESWRYGYEHAHDWGKKLAGMSVAPKFACAAVGRSGTEYGGGLNREDIIAGCLAGLKDLGYE